MSGSFVVLTAAGSGTRLGADLPKALVQIGGRTILALALERVLKTRDLAGVVITCPPDDQARFLAEVAKISAEAEPWVRVVPGGSSRQASVSAGLTEVERLTEGCLDSKTPVLVHDAARCLTPPELFDRLIELVRAGHPAVIPILPVTDTTVRMDPETGLVAEDLDRASLAAVQTPQGFAWHVLKEAHGLGGGIGASGKAAATDDASLVRRAGYPVLTTPGSELGLKVTVPGDIELAKTFLA